MSFHPFFPLLYGVVPPFFFLNPLSKITFGLFQSSSLWNPLSNLNHSETLTLSITLSPLPLSLVAVVPPLFHPKSYPCSTLLLAQPKSPSFHPCSISSFGSAQITAIPPLFDLFLTLSKSQSLSRLCLSPSSSSHCRSSAQISSSLSQSLNHSLVSASLPRRRRNLAQIAAHSLTLISPSPSSPSQLTLCLAVVAVVWYFITSNLFFLC